ncbi:MAG TPA: acylphosphatase [Spirochaetia bacterium]|nr:acylphosphatase [Spirochaetia bacterium]
MPVQAYVVVTGNVQGVYFRLSTKEEADARGVTGWVRNCADGGVAMVAQGEKEAVDRLIAWCHEGPPRARVKEVRVEWEQYGEGLAGFAVRG